MDKSTSNHVNALTKSVLQERGQYLNLPNSLSSNQTKSNESKGDKNANYCINNNGLTASVEELQALKKKLADDGSDGGSPPVYAEDCLTKIERGLWDSKLDFIFGCISYAVGLGV